MAISVIINSNHTSLHLRRTLESVKDFDEIVVCDMNPEDIVVKLAQSFGCRIVQSCGADSTPKSVHAAAIASARCEWVLFIDADEVVSPELREYLYEFAADPGTTTALRIPRLNYLLGKWKRSSYPDYQLRFSRRESTGWPVEPSSNLLVDGKVRSIPAVRTDLALIHISPTLEELYSGINDTTSRQTKRQSTPNPSVMHLLMAPFWTFLKTYFIKGAYQSGKAGVISAANDSIQTYMLLAKHYEKIMSFTAGDNNGVLQINPVTEPD